MTKIPMLHNLKDKDNLIKSYFIALIPLLIFGFYKNGLLLYNNNLLRFKNIFIPLYFYIISIVIAIIISIILKENYKENILLSLILASTISLNTNIFIYGILLFVLIYISKYLLKKNLNFNYMSIIRVMLLLSLLFGNYSYLNIGEKLSKFNYNLLDIFLGFGVGGLASTSIFILVISYIILSFNRYYKKLIPLSSILSYIIVVLSLGLITHNYNFNTYLLNGTTYFSFVFIAADIKISPYSNKGKIIYGILIGSLTALLSFNSYYLEASFLSIFLVSLLIPLINRLAIKKSLHN